MSRRVRRGVVHAGGALAAPVVAVLVVGSLYLAGILLTHGKPAPTGDDEDGESGADQSGDQEDAPIA